MTWSEVRATGGTGPGARRAGPRRATYTLELTDGKRTTTCDVDESAWRRYADRQQVKARVRKASGKLVCSSL